MAFSETQIRSLSVAVLLNEGKLLALECFDSVKREKFYRLIGGGIEFGEKAEETVVREFQEEFGLDIRIVRRLGVEENIFTYEGNSGHEIVFFFEAAFVNSEDYHKEIKPLEQELKKNRVVWIEPTDDVRIYPEGWKEFI